MHSAGARHLRDIDYRHLVEALKRKPGAFARWVLRDAAFPRAVYRLSWERLAAARPEREACKTMVGLLALAADGHEAQLAHGAHELEQLIDLDQLPDLHALKLLLAPPRAELNKVVVRLWVKHPNQRSEAAQRRAGLEIESARALRLDADKKAEAAARRADVAEERARTVYSQAAQAQADAGLERMTLSLAAQHSANEALRQGALFRTAQTELDAARSAMEVVAANLERSCSAADKLR